ncbi:MAG: fibronectin type III domain-containing protein [Thermoanaerobaculia bacterium]|nr:fibronectin type III domain-containing protein [Thermoanaerobaculia bacterium]
MNAFALLFALLPLQNENTAAGMSPAILPLATVGTPAEMTSFMVSDDYAQIDWKAVPGADAYQIQIRKDDAQSLLILEDKTVWTSFYFRVAQPQTVYFFRVRASTNGKPGGWSPWKEMNTQSSLSETKH